MAVSGKTARRLLKYLLTTDPPSIHEAAELLANQLDNDVELKSGKLSERPAASLFGKLFYIQGDATASNNGVLWLDLGAGSGWVSVARLPSAVSEYQTLTPAEGSELENNSARPWTLTAWVLVAAGVEANIQLSINGLSVVFPPVCVHGPAAGEGSASQTIVLPPGAKLKWVKLSGTVKEVKYFYVQT